MPAPRGSIGRTLAELTVGTVQSMQERQASDAEVALQETTQQYQVQVSGESTGSSTPTDPIAWADVDILFDYEFYYAPGQRDSDLRYPQFYYGVESVGSEDDPSVVGVPVAIVAAVTRWALNPDTSAVIGAKVAVGQFFTEVGSTSESVVHLSFQGFTALADVEVDYPDL